jgi:hypothetical protein
LPDCAQGCNGREGAEPIRPHPRPEFYPDLPWQSPPVTGYLIISSADWLVGEGGDVKTLLPQQIRRTERTINTL